MTNLYTTVRAELSQRHDSRALRARHGRWGFVRFALTSTGFASAVFVAAFLAAKVDTGAAAARAIMGGNGPTMVAKAPLVKPVLVTNVRLPQPRPAH